MVAAIFGAPPPAEGRKKLITYGRQSRLPKRPSQTKTTETTSTTATTRLPSQHESGKAPTLPKPQSRSKRDLEDDFDVPSSDSEETPVQRMSRPDKKLAKRPNVRLLKNDTPKQERVLASVPKEKPDFSKDGTTTDILRTSRPTLGKVASEATSPSNKRKRGGSQEPSRKAIAPKVYGKTKAVVQKTQRSGDEAASDTTNTRKAMVPPRTLKEGISAPARLANMVDETLLAEDTSAESPQVPVRRRAQHNTTPTPLRSSHARPALVKTSSSITPKQSRLWDQLLELEGDEASALKAPDVKRAWGKTRVRTDSKGLKDAEMVHPQLDPSPPQPSRMRLADRLKQDSQKEEDPSELLSEEDSDEPDPLVATSASQGAAGNSQGASGPRSTYAQTRSYLQEVNLEDSLLMPLIDLAPKPASKAASQNDMDLDLDDEPSQGIRSIHELRAAGSKKRFLDDVDILLDDLKDRSRSGWSKRRSALMELSRKLEDLDFAARFAANGFVSTVVQAVKPAKQVDLISDSVLLVIFAQIADLDITRHVVDELVPVVTWIVESGLVANSRPISSISRDRDSNMAKVSRDSYVDFMQSLGEISFWRSLRPTAMTLDILALRGLEAMVLKLRKSGHRQPLINSASNVEAIAAHVALVSNDSDHLMKRHLALSTLEAESICITLSSVSVHKCWTSPVLRALITFFADLLTSQALQAEDLTLALRLLLNLTNNQSSNCSLFATTNCASNRLLQHIGSVFASYSNLASIDNATLDTLLLSLGLAINLAEHSDPVRKASLPTKEFDPLGPLIKAFLKGREASSQADSMEEGKGNVAYGYLAVLLGNLCLNEKVKTGASKQMSGLESLILAVEEFLGYHRRVDDGQEAWEGFTERLGAVLTKLRA
ncbi:Hypothetical protein D9617_33g038640 [Elsinoe fawcettii]|nr:Hypothetical protein D9617_33g038640 [Elsinoe fawcettii]